MTTASSADIARLRSALGEIERDARGLQWNDERPWRTDTHLFEDKGLAVLDLHDLSIRLGVRAVELASEVPLKSGALVLITGRGRHTIDGRSRLRDAVADTLVHLCDEHGWSFREGGPGRWILVTDDAQAPARASGKLEWWLVAGMLAFVGLAVVVAPVVGVPLALLVGGWLLWSWLSRRRASED